MYLLDPSKKPYPSLSPTINADSAGKWGREIRVEGSSSIRSLEIGCP
jgi:hypothetical protein